MKFFERISNMALKQLEYQKQTDLKWEQIFEYISEHEETSQKVFYDGQVYDVFSPIVSLMQKAEKEITLIDGYVDVENFNAQYPTLEVKYTKVFHDRFLILDRKKLNL